MAADYAIPYAADGQLHCDECGEELSYCCPVDILEGDDRASHAGYWRGLYTLYQHYRAMHPGRLAHVRAAERVHAKRIKGVGFK